MNAVMLSDHDSTGGAAQAMRRVEFSLDMTWDHVAQQGEINP
jgi:hypothetical protein